MSTGRWLVALILSGFAITPFCFLFLEAASLQALAALRDPDRLLALAAHTVALCGLTLVLAMPLGAFLAAVLYRSDLPGRRALRAFVLATLFVPLPLFASAWQSMLGMIGSSSAMGRGDQGLLPAACVHALAALPWVVWLIGRGISSVEREIEEDALQVLPARRVLWLVTFRRARPAIAFAVLWVIVQTVGEIVVTDMMMVRTFAEEVYTQFVSGGGLGGAVLIALPQIALLLLLALRTLRGATPMQLLDCRPPRPLLSLVRARWFCFAGLAIAILALVTTPILSLFWIAGGGSEPAGWSAARALQQLGTVFRSSGAVLGDSLFWSAMGALAAATLALIACWLAREARWFRLGLLIVAVALWITPGPVLGYGVRDAIDGLLNLEDRLLNSWTRARPLAALLYYQPTPLPVLWVNVLRILPFAIAVLWPAVRHFPRDLLEAARVDGATPFQELRHVVWPLTRGAFLFAVVVGTILSFGELSAGKMVEVPGRLTYAQELFNQMHYGVSSTVAALCIWHLAALAILGTALSRISRSAPNG